ncbi:MAG: DoxX family membrane protein [Acidobacteriota bacterium]|nr:DoxX family membrane protein [Acidobacteriota bacterium]
MNHTDTEQAAGAGSVAETILRPDRLLRVSLGLVYLWFGALKVLGMSPVVELVRAANPLLATLPLYVALAAFEVGLGVVLLVGTWTRMGAAAATLHLFGTFAVVVSSPRLVFQPWFPFLTMEGEFLIKNLVLLAAAAALWSLSRQSSRTPALWRLPRVATVSLLAALVASSAGLGVYLHQSLRAVGERAGRLDWRTLASTPVTAARLAAANHVTIDGVISARCPLLGCWIRLRDDHQSELFIDLAPSGLSARQLSLGSPVRVEAKIGKTRDGEVGLVASRIEVRGM